MQNLRQQQARRLRKEMTEAERKLWSKLRHKQLGGLRFRRQVPLGNYIVDFACIEPKIIIEVDGSQHADHIDYDEQRTRWLETLGYTVLRFWNNQVLHEIDAVLQTIWNVGFTPPSALRAPSP
jgi:very-short-patch-repair endonuclease